MEHNAPPPPIPGPNVNPIQLLLATAEELEAGAEEHDEQQELLFLRGVGLRKRSRGKQAARRTVSEHVLAHLREAACLDEEQLIAEALFDLAHTCQPAAGQAIPNGVQPSPGGRHRMRARTAMPSTGEPLASGHGIGQPELTQPKQTHYTGDVYEHEHEYEDGPASPAERTLSGRHRTRGAGPKGPAAHASSSQQAPGTKRRRAWQAGTGPPSNPLAGPPGKRTSRGSTSHSDERAEADRDQGRISDGPSHGMQPRGGQPVLVGQGSAGTVNGRTPHADVRRSSGDHAAGAGGSPFAVSAAAGAPQPQTLGPHPTYMSGPLPSLPMAPLMPHLAKFVTTTVALPDGTQLPVAVGPDGQLTPLMGWGALPPGSLPGFLPGALSMGMPQPHIAPGAAPPKDAEHKKQLQQQQSGAVPRQPHQAPPLAQQRHMAKQQQLKQEAADVEQVGHMARWVQGGLTATAAVPPAPGSSKGRRSSGGSSGGRPAEDGAQQDLGRQAVAGTIGAGQQLQQHVPRQHLGRTTSGSPQVAADSMPHHPHSAPAAAMMRRGEGDTVLEEMARSKARLAGSLSAPSTSLHNCRSSLMHVRIAHFIHHSLQAAEDKSQQALQRQQHPQQQQQQHERQRRQQQQHVDGTGRSSSNTPCSSTEQPSSAALRTSLDGDQSSSGGRGLSMRERERGATRTQQPAAGLLPGAGLQQGSPTPPPRSAATSMPHSGARSMPNGAAAAARPPAPMTAAAATAAGDGAAGAAGVAVVPAAGKPAPAAGGADKAAAVAGSAAAAASKPAAPQRSAPAQQPQKQQQQLQSNGSHAGPPPATSHPAAAGLPPQMLLPGMPAPGHLPPGFLQAMQSMYASQLHALTQQQLQKGAGGALPPVASAQLAAAAAAAAAAGGAFPLAGLANGPHATPPAQLAAMWKSAQQGPNALPFLPGGFPFLPGMAALAGPGGLAAHAALYAATGGAMSEPSHASLISLSQAAQVPSGVAAAAATAAAARSSKAAIGAPAGVHTGAPGSGHALPAGAAAAAPK